MEIFPLLLVYLISGVIFGAFCAFLADQKGYRGGAWFFLGLLFSFLALLVLIGLPNEQRPSREQGGAPRSSTTPEPYRRPSPVQGGTLGQSTARPGSPGSAAQNPNSVRLCPHCIQEVHELASACPHCQRSLPEVERCSYEPCGKIINPTDNRCEDDEGNLFCHESHMRVEHCYYQPCGKVIEPTDDRCEDDEGNPFCHESHMRVERCSYPLCNKVIEPTDDRCEDRYGNLFCSESHKKESYRELYTH